MWSIDFRKTPQAAQNNPLSAPFIKAYHFGYMDYLPNWYFFWHQHPKSAEVVLIQEGSGCLHVGNQRIPLAPGHICIVPPLMLHYFSTEDKGGLRYYSLGLSTDDPDCDLSAWVNGSSCLVIPLAQKLDFLTAGFQTLAEHIHKNQNQCDAVFQSLLYGILMWIRRQAFEMHIEPVGPGKVAIQEVLTYIAEHYSETLTLNQLSRRFGISPAHLSRLFKQTCGLSPINYIIYYRISQSVIMLQATNMSIADITYAVGYQNQAYFSNLFSQQIGFTPTAFRTRYIEEMKQNHISYYQSPDITAALY